MIKEHYTDPDTGLLFEAYPTENQFRYRAAQFVDEKKRAGSVKYNKDMRGILGSSRQEADGPGAVYQIDATVADIYLVSHTDPYAVVGRPELYFVTDVFSRMIVGFYACLSSASWDNARSALLNAFTDKVDFCRTYGIHICSEDWPCVGLPRALVVDNGELISKASNAIISELGITVKNEPAWRPDLKGIVESRFRLLNISTKAALPGAVLPDAAQRLRRKGPRHHGGAAAAARCRSENGESAAWRYLQGPRQRSLRYSLHPHLRQAGPEPRQRTGKGGAAAAKNPAAGKEQ